MMMILTLMIANLIMVSGNLNLIIFMHLFVHKLKFKNQIQQSHISQCNSLSSISCTFIYLYNSSNVKCDWRILLKCLANELTKTDHHRGF